MARLVFRDFDEFAEAITGVDGRFIPTARSTSEWWIEAVRPGSVSLQQIQIGSATTFAGDGESGRLHAGLADDRSDADPDRRTFPRSRTRSSCCMKTSRSRSPARMWCGGPASACRTIPSWLPAELLAIGAFRQRAAHAHRTALSRSPALGDRPRHLQQHRFQRSRRRSPRRKKKSRICLTHVLERSMKVHGSACRPAAVLARSSDRTHLGTDRSERRPTVVHRRFVPCDAGQRAHACETSFTSSSASGRCGCSRYGSCVRFGRRCCEPIRSATR